MELGTLKKLLETWRSRLGLDTLSQRERLIVLGGGLVVVVLLLYQFIVSPYLLARKRVIQSIETRKTEFAEIVRLKRQYEQLRVEEGDIKVHVGERAPGFTLFTFLDQQAEKAEVKALIKYMKPSLLSGEGDGLDESIVEMKLEGISLARLVEFLQLTESEANVVAVRRMSVQVNARVEGQLDVILQYVTLVEAG
ncbi:MAG: type II secretion system protein GspM [Desulfopila sp.]